MSAGPSEREAGPDGPVGAGSDVEALADEVAALREEVETLTADADPGTRKMTIVATKGTLDMAYPPLILATTGAAFGWDVTVFFTFWGLDVLHEARSKRLRLSAVGNPSLPIPNALAALPGMDRVTTRFMERKIDAAGTASVAELIDLALETGVDLQACQMTADLMGYDTDAFYDGVTTGVGAASALAEMAEADVQLMI